ncbi:MAG: DUF4258 domain-containing protein [Candidatus Niyogibacteria bacterium]|nr:DUF4258 domain-containing protein [Candidatus Niyogibacteria bacterium]
MKIRYSKHAIERMKERGISGNDIKEILLKGQNREFQSDGSIKCVYINKDEKIIVIYYQEKENFKIITAYKI